MTVVEISTLPVIEEALHISHSNLYSCLIQLECTCAVTQRTPGLLKDFGGEDRHQLYKAEGIGGRKEQRAFPTGQRTNEKRAASADTPETRHSCIRPTARDGVDDKAVVIG